MNARRPEGTWSKLTGVKDCIKSVARDRETERETSQSCASVLFRSWFARIISKVFHIRSDSFCNSNVRWIELDLHELKTVFKCLCVRVWVHRCSSVFLLLCVCAREEQKNRKNLLRNENISGLPIVLSEISVVVGWSFGKIYNDRPCQRFTFQLPRDLYTSLPSDFNERISLHAVSFSLWVSWAHAAFLASAN